MIHNKIEESIRYEKWMNNIFVIGIGLFELILLLLLSFIVWDFAKQPFEGNTSQLYNLIALGLMILWVGLLVAYYAWAIYFYNINLGITNQDWADIWERKQYVPESEVEAPTKNPHANETLGLPPGTLRGTLALTLLVGGIAMTIASLGMDSTVKANSFVVDNLDFFKTAFLMMIAFYFGNKALEIMNYKSTKVLGPGQDTTSSSSVEAQSAPVSPVTQAAAESKTALQQRFQAPVPVVAEDNDFDNPKAVQ